MKIFHKDSGEEHNFWMSYTDLMSGFLVVFIIISIVMYQQYDNSRKIFEQFSGMSGDSIATQISQMKHELDSMKGADLKNLINEYKDVFVSNDNIKAQFNTKRGSIVLSTANPHKYLFASGRATFEPELKDYIDKIRKPLVEKTMVLWEKHNYKNVELRIEGHTDPKALNRGSTRGDDQSFLDNLRLSSERANNVYQYILNNDELTKDQKNFVKKNMISVGYSFSTRMNMNNVYNVSEDAKSRRIEFRIISK